MTTQKLWGHEDYCEPLPLTDYFAIPLEELNAGLAACTAPDSVPPGIRTDLMPQLSRVVGFEGRAQFEMYMLKTVPGVEEKERFNLPLMPADNLTPETAGWELLYAAIRAVCLCTKEDWL